MVKKEGEGEGEGERKKEGEKERETRRSNFDCLILSPCLPSPPLFLGLKRPCVHVIASCRTEAESRRAEARMAAAPLIAERQKRSDLLLGHRVGLPLPIPSLSLTLHGRFLHSRPFDADALCDLFPAAKTTFDAQRCTFVFKGQARCGPSDRAFFSPPSANLAHRCHRL